MLLLLTTTGDFGLGEPWDSLVKGAGAFLILLVAALWRKWLYLPGVVDDLRERIDEFKTERERLLNEQKEMTKWLQDEAIPLVSRSTAVIERITEQVGTPQSRRKG